VSCVTLIGRAAGVEARALNVILEHMV